MRNWYILGLTPKGENTSVQVLTSELKLLVKPLEIFIPFIIEEGVKRSVLEGYIFVAVDSLDDLAKLYNSKNFNSECGYSRIEGKYISKLQKDLYNLIHKDYKIGDTVKIVSGPYCNLCGEILGVTKNDLHIQIKFRSKNIMFCLNKASAEKI